MSPLREWTPPPSTIHLNGEQEFGGGTFVKHFSLEAAPGSTLAEMLARVTRHPEYAEVHIVAPSGVVYGPIPSEWWTRVRPKLGRLVMVHLVPRGGDSRKERFWFSILIAAAASAVSYGMTAYLTPLIGPTMGAFAGALAGSLTTIAGAYLMNQLIPPETSKLDDLSGARSSQKLSQTLSITGSQNRANLYGPIPVIYGQAARWPAWR